MKKSEWNNAVTEIDRRIIDETLEKREELLDKMSEKEGKKARRAVLLGKFKWAKLAAPVAILLALVIVGGTWLGGELVSRSYSISLASYPAMAGYPGDVVYQLSDQKYKKWVADRNVQRAYRGAGKNLDVFFKESIPEFLSGAGDENRVYSPLNVYMALAMLAEITDGSSRAQVLSLLGASSIGELRTQAHAVWNANYCDDGAVTSILGCSLWLDKQLKYNKDTLDALAENYYASSFSGQMGSDAYNRELHKWINEQTGGLLKNSVDNIEMDAETVMDMVTTIYFRAKWDSRFPESATKNQVFHANNGDVMCAFMHKQIMYSTYYWGEKFSAAALDLKEDSGKMYFILPDEGVSVDELLSDDQALGFIVSDGDYENSKSMKVNFAIPKFDVSSETDLSEGLANLGVTDCFDMTKADYTPLVSEINGAVSLSRVNHGARVAIDEEGVTAAAYTEMNLVGNAEPPKDEIDFTLDRPFIFVLTGADSLPLFVGIVNQP